MESISRTVKLGVNGWNQLKYGKQAVTTRKQKRQGYSLGNSEKAGNQGSYDICPQFMRIYQVSYW